MRYPRRKPSIALATIAVAVVASPFAVVLGTADPRLVDDSDSVPETTIERVPLRDLPAMVLDVVNSGLGAAGVQLPEIDPNLFPLPDVTVPVPGGVLPTSSAPESSESGSAESEPSPPTTSAPETTSETMAPEDMPTESMAPETTTESMAPTSPSTQQPAPRGGTSASPTSSVPQMADGREVGAAVTTIKRDKPLKMVAFTWDKPVDVDMMLRAREPDGTWGPWTAIDMLKGLIANPTTAHPTGTEPIWVGDAKEVQVAATSGGVAIPAAETQGGGTPQYMVGTDSELIAELASTALGSIVATLISPEGLLSLGSSLLTGLLGGPQVIARPQWGADEAMRCSQPRYSPAMRGAIVHHTAGSNDYSPQQSAEIVRGIYAYHARTLNWCDIGYNVLIDKYGQIFEGTFGGLDRNVQGTHTGGFNRDTLGVSMIGNLDTAPPTAEMISATSRFLRWRLGKAGLNAGGVAHLTSDGFSGSKFPAGAQTNLPMISGHRDYNSTACPGQFGYAALPQIRAMAGAAPPPQEAPPAAPEQAPAPAPEQAPPPGEMPPGEMPPAQAPPAEVPPPAM